LVGYKAIITTEYHAVPSAVDVQLPSKIRAKIVSAFVTVAPQDIAAIGKGCIVRASGNARVLSGSPINVPPRDAEISCVVSSTATDSRVVAGGAIGGTTTYGRVDATGVVITSAANV
jgi:hypothetical protein